jgi:hypothetical protein
MKTREAFEALFDAGYGITDFITMDGASGREAYYVLQMLTPELRAAIGIEK